VDGQARLLRTDTGWQPRLHVPTDPLCMFLRPADGAVAVPTKLPCRAVGTSPSRGAIQSTNGGPIPAVMRLFAILCSSSRDIREQEVQPDCNGCPKSLATAQAVELGAL
jgi:hypothetical protein